MNTTSHSARTKKGVGMMGVEQKCQEMPLFLKSVILKYILSFSHTSEDWKSSSEDPNKVALYTTETTAVSVEYSRS